MPESNLIRDSLLETRDIGIDGMTCDTCVRRVEKALRAEDGVKEVKVDRSKALATVTFDTKATDIPRLHEALLRSGYKAKGPSGATQ